LQASALQTEQLNNFVLAKALSLQTELESLKW
jgi:hypothetical protein